MGASESCCDLTGFVTSTTGATSLMFWATTSLQLTQLTLVTPLFALKRHLSSIVVFWHGKELLNHWNTALCWPRTDPAPCLRQQEMQPVSIPSKNRKSHVLK